MLRRALAVVTIAFAASAVACPDPDVRVSAPKWTPPPPMTTASASVPIAPATSIAIPVPRVPRPIDLAPRDMGKAHVAHLGSALFRSEGDTNGLVMSPDGARLVMGGRDAVVVWDAATGQEVLRFADGYSPQHMQMADGHRLLATMSDNHRWVRLFDLESKMLVFEVERKGGYPSFALASNGRALAWEDESTIHLIELPSLKEIGGYDNPGSKESEFRDLALSPDGKTIYVARNGLRAIDAGNGNVKWKRPTSPVPVLAVDPTGKLVAHAAFNGVELLDVATGEVKQKLESTSPYDSKFIAFSRDGTRVAVSGHATVGRIFDVATGGVQGVVALVESVGDMVFSSTNGDVVFTAWRSGPRKHVRKKALLLEEEVSAEHTAWVHALAATPDGKTVVSGGDDGRVIAWDVATRKGKSITVMPTALVRSIAVSRDGKWLAFGGRVHDVAAQKKVAEGHGYLGDGSLIAFVEVWDLSTGKRAFASAGAKVRTTTSLAFSADGKQLLSTDEDSVRGLAVPSGAQLFKRDLPKVSMRWAATLFDATTMFVVEERGEKKPGAFFAPSFLAKIHPKTGAEAWSIAEGPASIAAALDAKRFAWGGANRCTIGDLENGKVVAQQIGGGTSGAGALTLSVDGVRCAFGYEVLTFFHAGVGGRELARNFGAKIEALAFAGKTLVSAGTTGVDLWDPGE